MPVFGSEACAPVGIQQCPAGWERDDTGYGCAPILPANACPAGTRPAIGQSSCVPVGDCNAAFPPADATIFVDDVAGAAGHYATLTDAVAAAPPGAVIAVGAKTFHEGIVIEKPLTLVGKCPRDTILDQAAANMPAIAVSAKGTVEVRNLAIKHQLFGGLDIIDQGELVIRDVVLDSNAGYGVHAGYGPKVTLERSLITKMKRRGAKLYGSGVNAEVGSIINVRDTAIIDVEGPALAAVESKATIDAERVYISTIRDLPGSDEGNMTSGFLTRSTGIGRFTESFITGVRGQGLSAADKGELTIVRSRIQDVQAIAEDVGISVYVTARGSVSIEQSTIAGVTLLGIYADNDGSSVSVKNTAILGPPDQKAVKIGRGIEIQKDVSFKVSGALLSGLSSAGINVSTAHGSVEDTWIHDVKAINWPNSGIEYGGFGLLVADNSQVTVARLTVDRATLSGFSVTTGASVVANDVLVRDTRELDYGGVGSSCQVVKGAKLELTGGAFIEGAGTSILAKDSELVFDRIAVQRTISVDDFAHGITLHGETATADLGNVFIASNEGIGIAVNGASARIHGGAIDNNGVAVHAQNGSFVSESNATTPLQPGELRISPDTEVKGNVTRVGSGIIPLPGMDQ
jgi:hypothetical protein